MSKLKSSNVIKSWISSIEDKALAARLERWYSVNKKNGIQALLLPQQTIQSKGMPVEIASIMDTRKAIFDIVHVLYIILESIGFYCVNDNLTFLASDKY